MNPIEKECARLKAAFGLKEPEEFKGDVPWVIRGEGHDGADIHLLVNIENPTVFYAKIDFGFDDSCQISRNGEIYECDPNPVYNELMAKCLYCLGVDEEVIKQKINQELTGHERLELREAMPREFWPTSWR